MKHFNQRIQQRDQGGFTLIELLVVIAILGILAAVVVFAVGNTTDNAQTQACKIERKTIVTAFEAFKATSPTGTYPTAYTDVVGTGNTNYLQEDPSTRWNFQATPGAYFGKIVGGANAGKPSAANPAGKCFIVI